MKKKVQIKRSKFRTDEYQMELNSWTNWLFVWDSGKSYPIAKINGEVVEWDELNALPEISNEDLVNAWFAQ